MEKEVFLNVNGYFDVKYYAKIGDLINGLLSKALYMQGEALIKNKSNSDAKALFQSLECLKKEYVQFFASDSCVLVDGIYDSEKGLQVTGRNALKALYNTFTRGNISTDMCTHERAKAEKPGVYLCYDDSYHGSLDIKYELIREGIKAERVFKALELLNDNYCDFISKDNVSKLGTAKIKK